MLLCVIMLDALPVYHYGPTYDLKVLLQGAKECVKHPLSLCANHYCITLSSKLMSL